MDAEQIITRIANDAEAAVEHNYIVTEQSLSDGEGPWTAEQYREDFAEAIRDGGYSHAGQTFETDADTLLAEEYRTALEAIRHERGLALALADEQGGLPYTEADYVEDFANTVARAGRAGWGAVPFED